MFTAEHAPHSEGSLNDLILKYQLNEVGNYNGMSVFKNRGGTFFTASGRLITAAHVIPKEQLEEDFIKPGFLDLAISRAIDPSFLYGPRLVRTASWIRTPSCSAVIPIQNTINLIPGNICFFPNPTELSEFQLKSEQHYPLFRPGVSGSPILEESGNVVGIITHGNNQEKVVACLTFASNLVVQPITNSGVILE